MIKKMIRLKQSPIPRHMWRAFYPIAIFAGMVYPALCIFYPLWLFNVLDLLLIVFFSLIWRKDKMHLPIYCGTARIPLVIVLVVLGNIGLNYIFTSVISFFSLPSLFEIYRQEAKDMTVYGVTLEIISMGITAPIVEELLFRGILLNRLKQ